MHAETHRLVGEHRQRNALAMQPVERFAHAGIERSRIEHVLAIIIQKELQGREMVVFIEIRQRALHQHGSAIADIRRDHFMGQRIAMLPGEHGVDGVDQVFFGVDQSSVEVEN